MFKNFTTKYATFAKVSKEEPVVPTQEPIKTPTKSKSMYTPQTATKREDELWQEWCVGQMPIHQKIREPKKMLECISPSSEEEQNALYEWCTGTRMSSESRDSRLSISSCDSNY